MRDGLAIGAAVLLTLTLVLAVLAVGALTKLPVP
jgi:hypothetical protein